MDAVLDIARRHNLRVIEDCAHTLGATYDGRPVGTLGDAAIFSFQTLKPLNLYGGGLALVRDRALADRVRALAYAAAWPDEKRITNRLLVGRLQRIFIKPWVFTISMFPILWVSAWIDANPDVYLWEKIRSLEPFPAGYRERYSNAQAAIGLAGLDRLDAWTGATRRNAAFMSASLAGLPGVEVPPSPSDRVHVYYQYPVYVSDRDAIVRRCLRHGLDVEYHHMDVCSELPLFSESRTSAPGAQRTTQALQVPVHAGLDQAQLERVAARLRRAILAEDAAPAAQTVAR